MTSNPYIRNQLKADLQDKLDLYWKEAEEHEDDVRNLSPEERLEDFAIWLKIVL